MAFNFSQNVAAGISERDLHSDVADAAKQMGRAHQNDGANRGHREERDPAVHGYPEYREQPLTDHGPDQAEDDIGQRAVAAAMHQLAGEPSGDQSHE